MLLPLVAGTVLAIGALIYVLYPLIYPDAASSAAQTRESGIEKAASSAPAGDDARRAVEVLREIEFDRQTGKLSDSDYAALKERFTSEALAAMRAADSVETPVGGASGAADDVEALIARFRSPARSCSECGPRPEVDALYCSNCGRFLLSACSHCGAAVNEPSARFCSNCGSALADGLRKRAKG
jgi:hypothetical protein